MTLKMMAIIVTRSMTIMHPSCFARSIRPSRVTCRDDVALQRSHSVSDWLTCPPVELRKPNSLPGKISALEGVPKVRLSTAKVQL